MLTLLLENSSIWLQVLCWSSRCFKCKSFWLFTDLWGCYAWVFAVPPFYVFWQLSSPIVFIPERPGSHTAYRHIVVSLTSVLLFCFYVTCCITYFAGVWYVGLCLRWQRGVQVHYFRLSFFCRGDEQTIFSVAEKLAVPQTIAFVCWNCLASCRLESGIHMNILFSKQ